ncbi:Aste57867_20354 [Aphanomyces stellatus]|uniref:Aste57867_20354 protein n=1 Tax=Aphanomyces stellatus TaxID=120398 RepID=A0A485LES2_9STRA|nr:hypothetical protein As57867_020288 [Aphanomyces stellatus]VFT97041.1 Aste57867_20354 [Aphanomyces stellatus]
MASQLPPLKVDGKLEELKDIELDASVSESECSSANSEANLIDDHTPSKLEMKDTPLTKVNLVALGSTSSQHLAYTSCRNILFALFLPLVVVGFACIFHAIAATHPKVNGDPGHSIDGKNMTLGAAAYVSTEIAKLAFEGIALKSSAASPLTDGALYPWGAFGAIVFACVDDLVRIVFVWGLASTYTFGAAYSFGLGWASLELACLLLSFASMCCNQSFVFSEAARVRRVLTRLGIRHYSLMVALHHVFSAACAVGAALLAFKVDSKLLVCITCFLRVIGHVVQNEGLRRRGSILHSSATLFLLQVCIFLLGLSVWEWGAVAATVTAVASIPHKKHKSTAPPPTTTPVEADTPETTHKNKQKHKPDGHHHKTKSPA